LPIPKNINILELGFGLGINLLTTLDTWYKIQKDADSIWKNSILNFVSIEKYIVNPFEIKQYLSQYFYTLTKKLINQWPLPINGFYNLCFKNANVTVIVDDVAKALEYLHTKRNFFDVFYLDGFSAKSNPEMWSENICLKLAKISKPHARVSTYSVCGLLKTYLKHAGFATQKIVGLNNKKEILTANYMPEHWQKEYYYLTFEKKLPKTAVIIGAGIAGASLAYRLKQYGIDVSVIDEKNIAQGASGNPIAILKPNASIDDNLISQLSRCSVYYTLNFLNQYFPNADWWKETVIKEHLRSEKMADKIKGIQRYLEVDAINNMLTWHKGILLEPKKFVTSLLADIDVIKKTRIEHVYYNEKNELWELYTKNSLIYQAELLVICNAYDALNLLDIKHHIKMQKVHGQITGINVNLINDIPNYALSGNGYLTLDIGKKNIWVGATYEHTDEFMSIDSAHQYNLKILSNLLPNNHLNKLNQLMNIDNLLQHRKSSRAVCNNHLPVIGQIPKNHNAYILSGLSSHGMSWANLCAQAIVADITNGILPWSNQLQKACSI